MDKNKSINKPFNKEEIIRQLYLEPQNAVAFTKAENILREAKKVNRSITRKDVESVLRGEKAYTLHKPQRITRYNRLRSLATAINSDWQADLAEFGNIAEKENDWNRYLLVVVDVFTRKMYGEPIKNKEQDSVVKAFKAIINRAKATPFRLLTDRGTEFKSSAFKRYCASNNIFQKFTYSDDIHAGIVERANRTIKTRLYKLMTHYDTNNWPKYIQMIIDGINKTKNRTTGFAPDNINHDNADVIYDKIHNMEKFNMDKPKFKVGDFIRLSKWKGDFDKGYLPNYTHEIFKIAEAKVGNPAYYKIVDLNDEAIIGTFYKEQFTPVSAEPNSRIGIIEDTRLVEGNNRNVYKVYKVHWIGEDSSKNEWVSEQDFKKI